MITGFPARLETLLTLVSNLFTSKTLPPGVDPIAAEALAGVPLPLFAEPARVLTSLVSDQIFADNPPADQFLVIAPTSFRAMESLFSGAGNLQLGTDGAITVTLWNRMEADLPLDDTAALEDPTLGILATWRACQAILSGFMPTDGNGNGLAMEPIRFLDWTTQQREYPSPWTLLRSRWQMRFNQALS